jgi:hypothetical protein
LVSLGSHPSGYAIAYSQVAVSSSISIRPSLKLDIECLQDLVLSDSKSSSASLK